MTVAQLLNSLLYFLCIKLLPKSSPKLMGASNDISKGVIPIKTKICL